jgi:ADP-heptose:LPS heptosyltransferase
VNAPLPGLTLASILCIRLDSLGDVLMTMPAVRAIKQALPASRITLLTSPAGAEPAPYLPEIDDVLVYQAPWMKPSSPGPQDYDHEMLAGSRRQFDAVVIFTVYSQSPLPAALFCTLAGIPAARGALPREPLSPAERLGERERARTTHPARGTAPDRPGRSAGL